MAIMATTTNQDGSVASGEAYTVMNTDEIK